MTFSYVFLCFPLVFLVFVRLLHAFRGLSLKRLLVHDFMENVPLTSLPQLTGALGALARYHGLGVNSSLTAIGGRLVAPGAPARLPVERGGRSRAPAAGAGPRCRAIAPKRGRVDGTQRNAVPKRCNSLRDASMDLQRKP